MEVVVWAGEKIIREGGVLVEGQGSRERAVGRLKIHLRVDEADERGLRSGRVTLGIGAGPRAVYLTGINSYRPALG